MRICVYGAGATGGHIAAKLCTAGHDVSIVARGPHLDAIRAHGLALSTGDREILTRPAASDDPGTLGQQDLVLVTVKATALGNVAEGIGPLIGQRTKIIFAQNGMQWWYPLGDAGDRNQLPDIPIFQLAGRFLSHMKPEQILGGLLYTANAVTAPGKVLNTSPDHNRIYFASIMTQAAADDERFRRIFNDAGVISPPVEDIRRRLWKKLLFNMSGSALALATGNVSSAAKHDPELGETFCRLVAEGLAIAEAYGHKLHDEMVRKPCAISCSTISPPSCRTTSTAGRWRWPRS